MLKLYTDTRLCWEGGRAQMSAGIAANGLSGLRRSHLRLMTVTVSIAGAVERI